MTQKEKASQMKLIAAAALEIAAQSGWKAVSYKKICRKTKLKGSDIGLYFDDTRDILAFIFEDLMVQVRAEAAPYMGPAWRDNLLEVIMLRFDMAEKNRAAFLSIPAALADDPLAVRKLSRILYRSSAEMLKLAGAPSGTVAASLFSALYLSLIAVWGEDESRDKSKTMAAADKRIGYFEQALGFLTKAA